MENGVKLFLKETSSYSSVFAIKMAIEIGFFDYIYSKEAVGANKNDLLYFCGIEKNILYSLIEVMKNLQLITQKQEKIYLSNFLKQIYRYDMIFSLSCWVESCIQYIDLWKNLVKKSKLNLSPQENTNFWNSLYRNESFKMTTILSFEWIARLTGKQLSKYLDKEASILDVGTGSGGVLLEIARSISLTDGVGVDLDPCEPYFLELKNKLGISKNIKFLSADMFSFVLKKKYDYIILSWILHDLCDANVEKLLKHINEYISDNGKLIIIERTDILNKQSLYTSLLSLEMFVGPGEGRERTKEEIVGLVSKSTNLQYYKDIVSFDGRNILFFQ